jgi:hypothetical protein
LNPPHPASQLQKETIDKFFIIPKEDLTTITDFIIFSEKNTRFSSYKVSKKFERKLISLAQTTPKISFIKENQGHKK